jgi:hypothetical protein
MLLVDICQHPNSLIEKIKQRNGLRKKEGIQAVKSTKEMAS